MCTTARDWGSRWRGGWRAPPAATWRRKGEWRARASSSACRWRMPHRRWLSLAHPTPRLSLLQRDPRAQRVPRAPRRGRGPADVIGGAVLGAAAALALSAAALRARLDD